LVTAAKYIPGRGDLVWLQFKPQAGHEQAGLRPAVVLSPRSYNQKTGLALFCPVTSQIKGYPFEVRVPDGLPIKGVVLCDQVKSLDWSARRARLASILPAATLDDILAKTLALLR
jgi:mRNA interferase MazF